MKKLFIFLMLLCVPLLAQNETWGTKVVFGTTFRNTDSLKVFSVGITDTLVSDTLYSNGLDIPGEGLEGIFGVAAYFDEVSGTSSSIGVQARLGNLFRSGFNTTNVKWDDWRNIFATCKKDTLYRLGIAASDSSWWNPAADVIQLRILEADADTVLHNVSLYIR